MRRPGQSQLRSRFEMKVRRAACTGLVKVNFAQKSKVKGIDVQTSSNLTLSLFPRKEKFPFSQVIPGHRLENTKSWDLTGICSPMMTDLFTDILTVETCCIYFRCLQLREVLCQLSML